MLSSITISKLLAMVAMRREVKVLLNELLAERGQSFFVIPASRYLPELLPPGPLGPGPSGHGSGHAAGGGGALTKPPSSSLSFRDLALRVQACGELAVGYQLFHEVGDPCALCGVR